MKKGRLIGRFAKLAISNSPTRTINFMDRTMEIRYGSPEIGVSQDLQSRCL